MLQRNSRGDGGLGDLKSCLHGGGPGQAASALAGIRERLEHACNSREKAVIKAEHAKEAWKGFDITGNGKVKDRFDVGGKRRKASSCNLMAIGQCSRSLKLQMYTYLGLGEATVSKTAENLVNVLKVPLLSFAEY
jgi:hypothetical protein